MSGSRLTSTFVVFVAFLLACGSPAIASGKKPPSKPKATPAKKPAKPKPKPNAAQAHNVAHTHAHSTPHKIHHNFYAARAPHSRSWYYHHRHHRWVYEVRVRSRRWHERAFASQRAAHTFMVYLRYHHFERHLHHPTDVLWLVTYRNNHSHHFGTYAALPVARRVEVSLRASGFEAWLRWHRRYYF